MHLYALFLLWFVHYDLTFGYQWESHATYSFTYSFKRARQRKSCDVFFHKGKRVCGPSVFILGVGKCGTNGLKSYMAAHPQIKFTKESEVRWLLQNKTFSVSTILDHNPGVMPEDTFQWVIKHPGAFKVMDENVARQVLQTFPSAKIFMTICDPSTLNFRWFRHYARPDVNSRVFNGLQHLSDDFTTIYKRLWNVDNGCTIVDDGRDKDNLQVLLSALPTHFQCSLWEKNFGLREKFMQWNNAGYTLHHNFEVFVMEDWKHRGKQYVTNMLSILRLPLQTYNFTAANSFSPVYSVPSEVLDQFNASSLDGIASQREIQATVKECRSLEAYLGQSIPWQACSRDRAHVLPDSKVFELAKP
eukprot:TRINITY_DN58230_c0_g1_i1.p1 TRINITY_DN58230_c0_g1~~TRINITY_DN58230_c0_g1_i1.p1  ORF type:complete len:359 (-),score=38.06 TRINITY_DN58230_c0_g1_i1:74-1150(-)